jgi:hypothetical protein
MYPVACSGVLSANTITFSLVLIPAAERTVYVARQQGKLCNK